MLHDEHFFLITQNKLKISIKTSIKKLNSTEILQGHVAKPSNDSDVDRMIKEKKKIFLINSVLMRICQLQIGCQH